LFQHVNFLRLVSERSLGLRELLAQGQQHVAALAAAAATA
jgi:hypothetical protein